MSISDKGQLRFITCGSVDDGKSTLLGRLLYDSKSILEDQISAATNESSKYGTQGNAVDLALLVDGLQAEREQGITIDVAYRFFETSKRKFIAADTPGHEQYTRNMATGASTADIAIVLIDARKGVIEQTRRHSKIVSLMGVRNVILAVNKMDLVENGAVSFEAIKADYFAFSKDLGFTDITAIPVSALNGDNIFTASQNMAWYQGPTLMKHLEAVSIIKTDEPFRMPVQMVNRPDQNFRGYCGMISGGKISQGKKIVSALSGKTSTITRIIGPCGDLETASKGLSVTLLLDDEIDISRGDILCTPDKKPDVTDQFAAHVIWMSTKPMLPERSYLAHFTTTMTDAKVTDLVHEIEVNTLAQHAAKTLELNAVGYCKFSLGKDIAIDPYSLSKGTGSFILIDKFTNETVGAGMVDFALRRASNIKWHEMKIGKEERAKVNAQAPCVLWFTGFSGSGKSTIADILEQKLHVRGKRTYLLDGDNVRHGLNRDLGFTDQNRVENIRRIAEVAKLMADAGLIVLTSFISPFRSERQMARELMADGEFIEIFVNTPLEICEARDPKGLYKKARAGELKNFTGIDSKYEPPENAEIVLRSEHAEAEALADQIIDFLEITNRIS